MADVWLGGALGLIGNLLTALIVYVVFQRHSARREQRERQRTNRNLVTAMLLQQYPALIDRGLQVQRDAYFASAACFDDNCPSIMSLANTARYASNLHAAIHDGLQAMGINSAFADALTSFTNAVGVVVLAHARAESSVLALKVLRHDFNEMEKNYDGSWEASSHFDRIRLLLPTFTKAASQKTLTDPQRVAMVRDGLEMIGQAAALYGEKLRRSFASEVISVRGEAEFGSDDAQ